MMLVEHHAACTWVVIVVHPDCGSSGWKSWYAFDGIPALPKRV